MSSRIDFLLITFQRHYRPKSTDIQSSEIPIIIIRKLEISEHNTSFLAWGIPDSRNKVLKIF